MTKIYKCNIIADEEGKVQIRKIRQVWNEGEIILQEFFGIPVQRIV